MSDVPMASGMHVSSSATANVDTVGRADIILGDANEVIAGASVSAIGGASFKGVVGATVQAILGLIDLRIYDASASLWWGYGDGQAVFLGTYTIATAKGPASLNSGSTVVMCGETIEMTAATVTHIETGEWTVVAATAEIVGNELSFEAWPRGATRWGSKFSLVGDTIAFGADRICVRAPVAANLTAQAVSLRANKVSITAAGGALVNGRLINLGQPATQAPAPPKPPKSLRFNEQVAVREFEKESTSSNKLADALRSIGLN
jgi:hypothetical protein